MVNGPSNGLHDSLPDIFTGLLHNVTVAMHTNGAAVSADQCAVGHKYSGARATGADIDAKQIALCLI